MSVKSDDNLESAVRKIEHVRSAVAHVASFSILRMLTDAIAIIESHECPTLPQTFVVGDEVAVVNDLEHLPVGTVFTDSGKTNREAMLTSGGRLDGVPRELVWSDGLAVNINTVLPSAIFPLTIKYLPGVH